MAFDPLLCSGPGFGWQGSAKQPRDGEGLEQRQILAQVTHAFTEQDSRGHHTEWFGTDRLEARAANLGDKSSRENRLMKITLEELVLE